MASLVIDVVSDVVCPWCLIGITRLNQALAKVGATDVEVRFHPFLLDPSTPPEGGDLRQRLKQKYGLEPRQMFERVEAAARESGIPLDFEKVTRTVNTLKAHTLIRHAAGKGTQAAVKLELLNAYFLEGKDVSDHAVLVDIASRSGFAAGELEKLLGDSSELERTAAEAESARRGGVTGVPFMIFGNRFAVSGAQSVEVFAQAIEQARAPVEAGAPA